MNNINSYKKSKILVKDLTELIVIIDEMDNRLKEYKKYLPVQELLQTITTSKAVLKVHYRRQKKILDSKGSE